MKRIKEIEPILTAIYSLNHLGDKEKIALLTEYALHELCDSNTNMLKLVVHVSKKENLTKDTLRLLQEETKFNDFVKRKEEYKNKEKQQ